MRESTILELLTDDMTEHERCLNRRLLGKLTAEFMRWHKQRERAAKARRRAARRAYGRIAGKEEDAALERRDVQHKQRRDLFDFIKLLIDQQLEGLADLDRQRDEFRQAHAYAPTDEERRRLILKYARYLGNQGRKLRGDARAFSRWFGEDALEDRFCCRRAEQEQLLGFCLPRLGLLASSILNTCDLHERDELLSVWRRLDAERSVYATLHWRGDPRLNTAALKCLTYALPCLPQHVRQEAIEDRTLDFLHRAALDDQQDVWVQCAALELLAMIKPGVWEEVVLHRLSMPGEGDDMFVRRHAIRLMSDRLPAESADTQRRLIDLFSKLSEDPSPFVRQEMARAIFRAPPPAFKYWARHLMLHDPEPRVRAAVLAEGLQHQVDRTEHRAAFRELLLEVMQVETDGFVLRTAIHVAVHCFQHPAYLRSDATCDCAEILNALRQLQSTSALTPVRGWAAQAAETLWCLCDSQARALRVKLLPHVEALRPGKSKLLRASFFRDYPRPVMGRVLAVLAQDDYGLDLESHWWGHRLTRGPVFGSRLWRIWHELRHPATDKRQGFRHTVGRVSDATLRAPSSVLSELSQTKVPGEPLFMPEDAGWRPFLPLVDDALSAVQQGGFRAQPVQFYTSEGMTELMPPRSRSARFVAALRLTFGFERYAHLRNWHDRNATLPSAYLQRLQDLGLQFRFRPHNDATTMPQRENDRVTQFFPCLVVFAFTDFLPQLQKYLKEYAAYYYSSVFENSLPQLLMFTSVVLALFLARHFYANHTLRLARKRLPLCIGGWGTRGKSGTERLKAALFSGLGYSVFSKSTGCEAMFLHGQSFGDLLEIILYRPYDKATIWEHRNVMRMAANANVDVFLWECMGLTPAYVDVLQRQWTQDDLSTITNTYPDHEDLQGPAGLNVAQVIAGFIPNRSQLFTSEQQMIPVLRDTCRSRNTELHRVGWLEAGLLTDDVLDRFPYKEHPENIALVQSLSEQFRCHADFALKEMADRLVPDLGVLKTYPEAYVNTRILQFTNGMSANERYACLGNWQRMGFDRQGSIDPTSWICTIVNNRADRVPRSRVFARILVNDISADRHFLIGGNLQGLQGFIWEAWEESAREFSLWSNHDSNRTVEVALESLRQAALRYGQPTTSDEVQSAIDQMLDGLPECEDVPSADLSAIHALAFQPQQLDQRLTELNVDVTLREAILRHQRELLENWQNYGEMQTTIRDKTARDPAAVDDATRHLMRAWFQQKLVIIDDYHATGDEILQRICDETPPGFRNRIMGLQNIKGTGLDFVYRWQAWEKCHEACEMLKGTNIIRVQKGLRRLAEFQEFGVLCRGRVRETVEQVQKHPVTQREVVQAELKSVLEKVNRSTRIDSEADPNVGSRRRVVDFMLKRLAEFVEVHDAIRRRVEADCIYRDLADYRISRERAVLELRALCQRQKGQRPTRSAVAATTVEARGAPTPRQSKRASVASSSAAPLPIVDLDGGVPATDRELPS